MFRKKLWIKIMLIVLFFSPILPRPNYIVLGIASTPDKPGIASAYDCATATGLPQAECTALVSFYNATGGDNWINKTNWLQTTEPCAWFGVTCTAGTVSDIYLVSNRLAGALPPEIGNLTALQSLVLTGNQLNALPPEIGNLTSLITLNLAANQLSALPSQIGNLTNLQDLSVYSNRLADLPPEIGNLPSLQVLFLTNNQLSALPYQLGNLKTLTYLYLNYNQLTSLPTQIGNLASLSMLDLSYNQLATLPSEFGNLSALQVLYLHNNPLSGEFPISLTSIPNLFLFTYSDTNWCTLETGQVVDWLAKIPEAYGPGKVCGKAPGALSGGVTLKSGVPAAGIEVSLYRQWGSNNWKYVNSTQTTNNGAYQFGDLGQGINYQIEFVDTTNQYASEYYNNQGSVAHATPITVTLGMTRTGINARLDVAAAPVAAVQVPGGSANTNPTNGTVDIDVPRSTTSAITVTKVVTCSLNLLPTDVNLFNSLLNKAYPMASMGNNQYQAAVPAADVTASNGANLTVRWICGGIASSTPVAYIYIYDPSGFVTDKETGQPIPGAVVTLYQVPGWRPKNGFNDNRPNTCQSNLSKASGDPWNQPAPVDVGAIANLETATFMPGLSFQKTNQDGHYGWNVSEGCWYVKVAADGYEPFTSPVVGVPPEVTDLNLALTPSGGNRVFLPVIWR